MKLKINNAIILTALVLLIITMVMITRTYALFETNGTADKNIEIGKWKIKLNNNDVSLTEAITLNDFQYTNGVHTEDGYFAPGSSAVFDIVIDARETDVSVLYNLSIDDEAIQSYPNIAFSITNLNTNETLDTNSYEGIIRLNDQNRVVTLRISLDWQDALEYDESDSSLIGGELEFILNANFKQYIE